MRSRTETAQETFSNQSIAQDTSESKRTDEPVKKSVRFQLGAPVEVNGQKDLVAVHNLTEENLREALDLGGMPSPFIAVVEAQEGHTKYGPISLVFAPDAIDPMANNANRIYGSDAWTPTRPNVEYEVHYDAMNAFESGDMDQLERLADRVADALEEKYTHGTLEGQNKRWQMRITKLHNPYTLENLVAAMNQQNKQSTGHKKHIFLRRQTSAAPTKLARFPSLESST